MEFIPAFDTGLILLSATVLSIMILRMEWKIRSSVITMTILKDQQLVESKAAIVRMEQLLSEAKEG